MAIQEVLISKIFNYTSEPTKKVEGQFWFNPSTNVLSRYNGTAWKAITVSSDDVAVLSSGNKVSLTNYLNTQIAALAEGIDTKQDKLKFYSEVDKSDDTSSDSTGSEINLKTLASQYGGSKINIFASQGESTSGKINLTSQAYSESADGGVITLLSDGVRGDGGEITLKAKTVGDGITGPGGNINIIAESNSTGSNILLSANSIQLDGGLNGTALNTSIPANTDDNHILTTKAVKTELDKKQDKLLYYSEVSGDNPSVTISATNINLRGSVAEGDRTTASGSGSHAEGSSTTASGMDSHSEGTNTTASSNSQHVQGKYNIEDSNNKYADIIGNGSWTESGTTLSNAATVSWNGISWSQTDVRAGGTDQDAATHSLAAKQNVTDNNLTTIDKTIVGAINELRKSIIGAFDPITDVWTATTSSSLTSIISNETYANTPGRILISPKITNTGAIKVGDNITDISKAFPLYPDQIVSFTFSDINNFKVAADSVNDGFNYVIEFSVISPYTSQSIQITE